MPTPEDLPATRLAVAALAAACALAAGCSGLRDIVTALPSGQTEIAAGCGAGEVPDLRGDFATVVELPPRGGGYTIRASEEMTLAEARASGFRAVVPRDQAGLDVKYVGESGGQLLMYLADHEIGRAEGELYLMADGGIIISEEPDYVELGVTVKIDGEWQTIPVAKSDRGTPIMIGSHEAVMIRDSEIAKGVRPYLITWLDGSTRWMVQGAPEDPEAVIDVARSMVCS
jgi:hypothetical protein